MRYRNGTDLQVTGNGTGEWHQFRNLTPSRWEPASPKLSIRKNVKRTTHNEHLMNLFINTMYATQVAGRYVVVGPKTQKHFQMKFMLVVVL